MKKTVLFVIMVLLAFSLLVSGCNSCTEKQGECCQGGRCSASGIACLAGTHPEFRGCNDMCLPQTVCTPD
jgi:hypothetical protein